MCESPEKRKERLYRELERENQELLRQEEDARFAEEEWFRQREQEEDEMRFHPGPRCDCSSCQAGWDGT